MGARAITDLGSVKSWAPSTQGVDDDVLERSLDTASALIEQYCGRRFASADYAARHSGYIAIGDYRNRLILTDPDSGLFTPNVTAVSNVTEDGATLATAQVSATAIADGDYAVWGAYGPYLYRVTAAADALSVTGWSPGDGNIVVEYAAGYTVDTMPPEIVQACIELTWMVFREGSRSGMTSRQSSVGSASFVRELSPVAQAALSFHGMDPLGSTLAA